MNLYTHCKHTFGAFVLVVVLSVCLSGPAFGMDVTYVGAVSGGLSAPTSLDASADQVAVLQPYGNQILVFTPDGVITRRIDIEGDARGLARLSATIYLYCDRKSGTAKAVDVSNGRGWTFLGSFKDPADITVTVGECHILDSSSRRIVSADSRGHITGQIDLQTGGNGVLDAPTSLAFDVSRNAFHVFNQSDSRVHVFGRSGEYLGGYCSFGNEGGTVTRGGGLSCDADGYAYIVDRYQGRVSVFDPGWNFVMDIETGAIAGKPLIVPAGIAVDPEGTIYVSSTEDNRIHIFFLDKTSVPTGDLAAVALFPAPTAVMPVSEVNLVARLRAAVENGGKLAADFRVVAAGAPDITVAETAGVEVTDPGLDDLGYVVGTASWKPGEALTPGTAYLWQVRARTEGRVGQWSNPVAFSTQPSAARYYLEANYPNPFNPRTTIAFTLPAVSNAEVDIFDLKGTRVWSKTLSGLAAGRHTLSWEGRDFRGDPVASGVYFYRLRAGDYEQTRKMVLIK